MKHALYHSNKVTVAGYEFREAILRGLALGIIKPPDPEAPSPSLPKNKCAQQGRMWKRRGKRKPGWVPRSV